MVSRENACILLDLIECVTSDNWPNVRDALIEMGYNGQELSEATGALATLAHRCNPMCPGDFES